MGPLAGFRIIEMAGIGPAPFAATLLADMGAEVIRVDRREAADLGLPGREPKFDVLHRGRRSLAVDLKAEAGRDVVKRLAAKADAPDRGLPARRHGAAGTLAPDELLRLNPQLVFGRMTGFGQEGPMAQAAGHDINYIALAGVLHAIGRKGEAPVPPLNLVGDFGGGGMFLAFGVVCALLEAQKSGKGQVVDAAMVDGAAYLAGRHLWPLLAGLVGRRARRQRRRQRRALVRRLQDQGRQVAVGRRHREALLRGADREAGPGNGELPKQHDRKGWPELRRRFAEAIASKTRGEWEEVFARQRCLHRAGAVARRGRGPSRTTRRAPLSAAATACCSRVPRRASRRTQCEMGAPARGRGVDSEAVLGDWGFAPAEIAELKKAGRGMGSWHA